MRDITRIIVHCTATPPDMDIGVPEVRQWHKDRGWSDIGYHFLIRRNGYVATGRPIERIGAHTKGYNSSSIGIALVGGVDKHGKPDFNFTFEQMESLKAHVDSLLTIYPHIDEIRGHRDFANKACPCFDVRSFFKEA